MVKIFIVIALLVAILTPTGAIIDFRFFYDAALNIRNGQNPYLVSGFYSPIHLMLYVVPLSFFSYDLAARINAFIASLVFLIALRKRLILFFTPFVLISILIGNLEWTTVLATMVNPLIGIPLAMVKPQLGWFLAVYLTIYSFFKIGKIKTFIVVALTFLSFVLTYYFKPSWGEVINSWWNTTFFPYTMIIGIPIIYFAYRHRDKLKALAAGIFFSPYVSYTSWCILLPWLSKYRRISIAIFIAGIVISIIGLKK